MAKYSVVSQISLASVGVKGTHNFIRTLSGSAITSFKRSAIAKRRGVYVFGLRNQGRVTPWYVGLAGKQSLGSEAMTRDKLRKYAAAMFGRTGTPVLTLLIAPLKGPRGPVDELETLVIWLARARNPKLINERKVGSSPGTVLRMVSRVQIQGVLNSARGKPSKAAQEFRRMMGLSK